MTPTDDHEVMLNTTHEADLLTAENEPPAVKNDSTPTKKGKKDQGKKKIGIVLYVSKSIIVLFSLVIELHASPLL